MESAPPATREIHLDRLRSFHEGLVAALGEAGLGGTRLAEVLSRWVAAECLQCGVRVTGEDIAAALAAEDARTSANPRHARLLQHYCARAGCPSYFYRFTFQPEAGFDWEGVLVRAAAIETGQAEAADDEAAQRRTQARAQRSRKVARAGAVVALLVVVWAARHWWRTGSLPGVAPTPKYQVDPGSLPQDPNTPRP